MAPVSRTVISTSKAPAPPPFLSQAIAMGNFLFCSGQIGSRPDTGKLVQGPIQERTKQIFSNLQAVLEQAGTGLGNIVKVNIFLTNMGDFSAVNEVYKTYFPNDPPARTCVCVKELPLGTDVEIECIAGLNSTARARL